MPNMKPILFNGDMVRALLEGRKTVMRRIVKLKYSNTHLEMVTNKYGTRLVEKQNEEPGITTVKNPDGTTTHKVLACVEKTPPYCPGDVLYVRETWCWCPCWDCGMDLDEGCADETAERLYNAEKSEWGCYGYRASPNPDEVLYDKWRPSIHMPREAARIFLRVTDVRVERLRDITEEQAELEGCRKWYDGTKLESPARSEFCNVWDSTIKPADRALYGWDANPWVWVIAFERISKEEAYGECK